MSEPIACCSCVQAAKLDEAPPREQKGVRIFGFLDRPGSEWLPAGEKDRIAGELRVRLDGADACSINTVVLDAGYSSLITLFAPLRLWV